jgi:ferritin-like metal-binding protein YciE
MKEQTIEDLYVDQLRDLYDAERQIIKALPKMIRAAASDELKAAINEHLEVTKEQEQRIVQIFEGRGEKVKAQKCKGMNGVLEEGSELVEKGWEEVVRDAAIIAAAQRVEHYEMSGYGTARALATLLGEDEAAQLLEKTLEEEKEADQKLTELSENTNQEARNRSEESASGKVPKTETRKETSSRKRHVA